MLQYSFTSFPELNTQRLLLRKLKADDKEEMLFLRSNAEVLRYLGKEPMKTVEEAGKFIQLINSSIEKSDSVLWGICLLDDPSKIIGTICIWNITPENFRGEIGYLLHPSFWGKGLMKEAINAVLDYGFNVIGLNSIGAQLSPENLSSVSVLEKTGFVKEGYLKENFYFDGEFSDTLIYSKLRSSHPVQ